MIGEPVVRAFRLEKLADEQTGPVLVCQETRRRVSERFRFRDLGSRQLEGFSRAEPIYALEVPTHGVPD
jgi:class 3 adenylate cyclase